MSANFFALLVLMQGADKPAALEMTKAVVCSTIRGYEDYSPLAEAVLVKDEKMMLYYKPTHYKIEKTKAHSTVRLTQDAKIRRRGEKAVLWSKLEMVKYEEKVKGPAQAVYMTNSISLKTLTPGDYDLEVILHDKLAKGVEARQVVPFTVKASGSN